MTERPALQLSVSYARPADLQHDLAAQRQHGALLLPVDPAAIGATQYQPVTLSISAAGRRCQLEGEVLQLIAGVGLVVRLTDPSPAETLAEGAAPVADPRPPRVKHVEPHPARSAPTGMGPLSWPMEKLQAEFASLPLGDKIRLAKYGKRHARALVLRSADKKLHGFLLLNPKIAVEEVAAMAAMTSTDPTLLRRIATSPEWLRHTIVVRNLVCNPKLPIPQVVKLLRHLPADEMRRLSKTGKVRAAVKREIIKRLDR